MSTTMAKVENIDRKWYVVDAAGKPLGRVAVAVASILRGKIKTDFTPNVDCGDHVIVINAAKIVLTGKKLDQKEYITHSGWIGGLKRVKYSKLMANRPEKAVELAVWGMLPKNTIGRTSIRRLKVYQGAEHENQAQKPVAYTGQI